MAALAVTLAILAASAADPGAGPDITDAQFDKALTAAAAQTCGAADSPG